MSEEATGKALAAAAREWVVKAEAVRQWREEHVAFWWPEGGGCPLPEPRVVEREALDELEKLLLDEQKAQERWARINRALLGSR